jgi:hypothetical protein
MKGLSSDIESAIETILEGLNYEFDINILDDSKMKATMDSKVASFNTAKKLLDRWGNSMNSPAQEKLETYVERLIIAGESAIVNLRTALGKTINYDGMKEEKFTAAVKAKPLILDAILDLDVGVNELRLQLDAGNVNLGEKEFKTGYPEKFANGEFYPLKKYHKNWLDKENDAIIIDPHCTLGEIIEISGLRIRLPKVPEDQTKILFSEFPKEEQYWRRQEQPKGITPDSVEAFDAYIVEEYRRIREGIWFMNNGVPVYLTGNMYFALQYCEMIDNGDFMNFRIAQLEMFYHLEACIVDKRCLGQIFLKSRRTGFTYIILAILLKLAITTKNGKFGMTSKSGDDVVEAFSKFSYMFLNLPFWLRPVVKGKEDSLTSLEFGKPSNLSKEAKKKRDSNTGDYLNTIIDWRPTKNGSYDSVKLNGYLGDECFEFGTKIRMSNTSLRNIEDIQIGESVLTGSGKSAIVVDKVEGVDEMYKVTSKYGVDFVINSAHRLLIEFKNQKKKEHNGVRELTPEEYLQLTDYQKRTTHLIKCSVIKNPEQNLEIDPYIFGCWLGDGYSKDSQFIINHKKDPEILEEVLKYAVINDFDTSEVERTETYVKIRLLDKLSTGANQSTGSKHKFIKSLKQLNVYGDKRIPEKYLNSSEEQRLEILSGIIDTDGYVKRGTAYISMSRLELMEDIYNLVKSLSIPCSEIKHRISNFETDVYSLSLNMNSDIKCRVSRKIHKESRKNSRRESFNVEYIGVGSYCGITLDSENTVVLQDYTVQKNCGKWERPMDYITHLGQIRPTMMPSGKVVGKAFIGSTMGSMVKGGQQFKELINGSYVHLRNEITGKTPTGLYFHFLPAQNNMEQFTDKYGTCWTTAPPKGTLNVEGDEIKIGSLDYLIATEEQLKTMDDKALNEQYRTYPRTVEHAMRDEATETVFNITKIYQQLENNEKLGENTLFSQGNFDWENGIKDGKVEWNPNPKGRFKLSWIPSEADNTLSLRNNVRDVNGKFYPLNDNVGALGCDPFTLKSTHGKGSKGAIHGKTLHFPEGNAPSNTFFLEYVARPSDETIFFEDVIMACRFYGMPVLVESNRIDLLRHMRNRGYRGFSINRLDRPFKSLNENEREYGGQVMSGKDIIDSHMNAIGSWITDYVGESTKEQIRPVGEIGNFAFQETLKDWLGFNPDNRTDYDATISSGLAIMACQKDKYRGKKVKRVENKAVNFFPKYSNNGDFGSRIITQKTDKSDELE